MKKQLFFKGSNLLLLFGALIVGFALFQSFKPAVSSIEIYVSPSGSDDNPGTILRPFLTIERAKSEVLKIKQGNKFNSDITVYLRSGQYSVDSTLIFTSKDGGDDNHSVEYKAYSNENVIISGGKVIKGKWLKSGGLWKISVPEVKNPSQMFRQLFVNGKRLSRSSSPALFTAGTLPQYQGQIPHFGYKVVNQLKQDDLLPFCSFQYSANDLNNVDPADLSNGEIIIYHSWECSWQSIYKIDPATKAVYLKTPSRYPVGFFSLHNQYRIENLKQYLTEAGGWYLDAKNAELWYCASDGEDPNNMSFIYPKVGKIITIQGDVKSNNFVQNLHFTGIKFQYNAYPMGINDIGFSIEQKSKAAYPWLDYSTGFSSAQGAPDCGQAIYCVGVTNCSFLNCDFKHLGNYALCFGKYCNNNSVKNSTFNDLGGGGVIIGFKDSDPIKDGVPQAASPSGNVIANCVFNDGGKVHPAAVGILVMQANATTIIHNEIYNFPYSGISCGWTWGNADNYSSNNVIKYNHIHDVMKLLADGGGIYTLGKQQGGVILGNVIHDIYKSNKAIGYFNNGIFFDEGSSMMTVDSNVIYNVQNAALRLNATDTTHIRWKRNFINRGSLPKGVPAKIISSVGANKAIQ